jgi:hypothetical protein
MPGLTGWFDRAPQSQQTQALQAMTEMRERSPPRAGRHRRLQQ